MPVLAPSDVEHSAVELDGRMPPHKPPPMRRDQSRTGAAAARAGYPGAAFPDPQPDAFPVAHCGDTDIRASRKQGVTLEHRSDPSKVDCVNVIDKKGRVRIADIGANGCGERAKAQLDAIGLHGMAERYLSPVGPH